MSNERFTEKKGKEDADISCLETSGRPCRQLKDYLRKQEAASVEENPGWSRGKAKAGIDALDNIRSVDIDRHSITGESILLLFFFVTFSRSFLLFFFLPESDVLIRRSKTQQHCCSRS